MQNFTLFDNILSEEVLSIVKESEVETDEIQATLNFYDQLNEDMEDELSEADVFLNEADNAIEALNFLTPLAFDEVFNESVDELFLAEQVVSEIGLMNYMSNFNFSLSEVDLIQKSRFVSESDGDEDDDDDDDDDFDLAFETDDDDDVDLMSESYYKGVLDNSFVSSVYAKKDMQVSENLLNSIYPNDDGIDLNDTSWEEDDIVESFAMFDDLYGKDELDSTLESEVENFELFLTINSLNEKMQQSNDPFNIDSIFN
jgi:hypothetical protein